MPKINLTEGKYSVNHNGRITKKGIEIHGPDGMYVLKPVLENWDKIPKEDLNKKAMFLLHESNNVLEEYSPYPKDMTEDKEDQRNLLKIVRKIGLTLKKDIFVRHEIKDAYGLIDSIMFQGSRLPMTIEEIKQLAEQGQTLKISPRNLFYTLQAEGIRSNYVPVGLSVSGSNGNPIVVPDYMNVEISLDDYYENKNDYRYDNQHVNLKAFDKDNNESSDFSKLSVNSKNNNHGVTLIAKFDDENKIKELKSPTISEIGSLDNKLEIDNDTAIIPKADNVIDSFNDSKKFKISIRHSEIELLKTLSDMQYGLHDKDNFENVRESIEKIEKIAENVPEVLSKLDTNNIELLKKRMGEYVGHEQKNDSLKSF